MVTFSPTREGTAYQFVLSPNRSMTWRQTKFFYASIVLVTLGIATGCAALGFWPILPFAGLEVGALGLALWICAQRSAQVEIVNIDSECVSVRKGRRIAKQLCKFNRAWAQVRLQRPRIAHYPSRLVIRSHGNEIELGQFLLEDERRALAQSLTRAISAPAALPT